MQTLLFTIHPNDLETLMIEAEQLSDVLESGYLKDKEIFDVIGQHLAMVLNNIATATEHHALTYSMRAAYTLSERLHPINTVHYNPVVHVVEIHQALEATSLEQFKKYALNDLTQHLAVSKSTADIQKLDYPQAELLLEFQQLKSFYQDATRQNMAVISVVAANLIAEKVI